MLCFGISIAILHSQWLNSDRNNYFLVYSIIEYTIICHSKLFCFWCYTRTYVWKHIGAICQHIHMCFYYNLTILFFHLHVWFRICLIFQSAYVHPESFFWLMVFCLKLSFLCSVDCCLSVMWSIITIFVMAFSIWLRHIRWKII